MTEETKTDEEKEQEAADKTLADEIADIDFTDDDKPLEDPADDSKTDEEEGNKAVKDDEESEEGSKDEDTKKEDTKVSEEEKGEKGPADDKGEKSEKSEEEKGKTEVSQVDKLLAEIERLSGLVKPEADAIKTVVDKDEKKIAEEEVEKKKIDEGSVIDFVKDLDMDDVSSDPKLFNKILHTVIAKVRQTTAEQVLRSIPQVVMSQVNQQTYFKRIADRFYEDNPDLVNVRQVVKACTQQIQQTNPEWEVEKVLKEAALKVRDTLGMTALKVGAGDSKIPSAEDAAFAGAKGGSKSNRKQQKTSLQMEIDEL